MGVHVGGLDGVLRHLEMRHVGVRRVQRHGHVLHGRHGVEGMGLYGLGCLLGLLVGAQPLLVLYGLLVDAVALAVVECVGATLRIFPRPRGGGDLT